MCVCHVRREKRAKDGATVQGPAYMYQPPLQYASGATRYAPAGRAPRTYRIVSKLGVLHHVGVDATLPPAVTACDDEDCIAMSPRACTPIGRGSKFGAKRTEEKQNADVWRTDESGRKFGAGALEHNMNVT